VINRPARDQLSEAGCCCLDLAHALAQQAHKEINVDHLNIHSFFCVFVFVVLLVVASLCNIMAAIVETEPKRRKRAFTDDGAVVHVLNPLCIVSHNAHSWPKSSPGEMLLAVLPMVYAFGGDKTPYKETVEALEDVVAQYVEDLVCDFHFSFAAVSRSTEDSFSIFML
jgi:hypothetical protein